MKIKNNKGFTLIELVVVIVILGVLAVTAAPRFLNYQRDAHLARADAAFASFQAAAQLYQAKWLTEGEPSGPVDYGQGDIYASATGFPISVNQPPLSPDPNGGSIAIRPSDCFALWDALIDTDLSIRQQGSGTILPSDSDIVVWYTASNQCYYYYTTGFSDGELMPELLYSPLTGEFEQVMAPSN